MNMGDHSRFHKGQCQSSPGKIDHSVASQNSYWRVISSKSMLSGIAWKSCPGECMGGCHRKGGGGGILRSEYEAGHRQSILPNHWIYQSGFPNKFSDWMRWITRERAYLAVQFLRNFKAYLPSFSSLWLSPSLVSATICSRPLISVSSCSSSFWVHYLFIY